MCVKHALNALHGVLFEVRNRNKRICRGRKIKMREQKKQRQEEQEAKNRCEIVCIQVFYAVASIFNMSKL